MRLWSLHPRYLDAKGMVALWREGLLAQKVLLGHTRGYKHHPQLLRFKQTASPLEAMATYLSAVADEARDRGYAFDRDKISTAPGPIELQVSDGQLRYEFQHLLAKLRQRSPDTYHRLKSITAIKPHPMMVTIKGGVSDWEKITPA